MANPVKPPADPEDYFSDSRMTFGEHLEDLRSHLWRAIYGFLLAMLVSVPIAYPVLMFIAAPVEAAVKEFRLRRAGKVERQLRNREPEALQANQPTRFVGIAFDRDQLLALLKGEPAEKVKAFPRPLLKGGPEAPDETNPTEPAWWQKWFFGGPRSVPPLGDPDEKTKIVTPEQLAELWVSFPEPLRLELALAKARNVADHRGALTTLRIEESLFVYFQVCLMCGLVLGSPWIFFQVWMFVAAGLYPHEKRLVNYYLPLSLGLFLAGVFIAEFFVMPKAIEALLWFNEWLGFEPDLRLSEWLGFAIMMPLVFGLSFQTPLVMLFVERIGIATVDTFRGQRRIAWFAIAIFAAFITPSTDPVSMMLLWVPMCLLFELGIWMCSLAPRQPDLGDESPDTEEMVEV